jgi:type I restriction enzyme S subunit
MVLPPLAEQHRIVAKIEELLPKVEEYGKAQDELNKLNAELPERLKKSILQEAIEGRLVPQDPNDEPASVLLAKIRKEKEQLVKEGKLKKKDLIETPISEEEIPFEIPESWEWVRIKVILSLQAGKNVTSADIHSEQNDVFKYPCYGGNGLRGYVKNYNNEGSYPLIGRQGALCGNVNMAHGQFWATEHAVVTDGWGMTDVKWQSFFLIALNLNKYATATAQPGLAVSNIIEVPIPLPPLAEQKRIVAKIEELLAEIDKLKV